MRRIRLFALLTCALALAACSKTQEATDTNTAGKAKAAAGATLRFSAIPDDNTTELMQKFGPVAASLSKTLGVPVEYVPSADYAASVEMFKNGDIHLAWFGGLTGVQARQAVPGAHAIVQGVEDPQYFSYFIANASTGLTRSDDFPLGIAALKFTFGSPQSTSGRLMPEHFIRENSGVAPAEFFTQEFGFSGSHDKTIELVASGTFEVGAVNYKTYDDWVAEGKVDPNVCRIIWKSPTYADYNFTAHPEIETIFGGGFTAKLQKAFLDMKDPALLDAFRRSGFVEAKDAEFDGILAVARALDMAR
jgi:phosphonate transport system substrate-binding protein